MCIHILYIYYLFIHIYIFIILVLTSVTTAEPSVNGLNPSRTSRNTTGFKLEKV